MSQKIFKHISIYFIKSLLLFHLGVSFIIFIGDFTEKIRDISNIDLAKLTVSSLAMIPSLITQVSPFIVLLASFATIRTMVLRKEVDIFKSFGISIWQFISPIIFVSLVWSVIVITVISPFAVDMLLFKERINKNISEISQQVTTATDKYIWVIDKHGNNNNIIATKKLVTQGDKTDLYSVAFLEINNNKFQSAVFAERALMEKSKITFFNSISKDKDSFYPNNYPELSKDSFLSSKNLTSLANNPEMIKIWNFPTVIAGLKRINFSSQSYEIYFYNLLSIPLLFITMILLSTRFSLYDIRAGKNLFAMLSCISIGFVIYFFINFSNVALITFNISPLLAVLSAKIIVLLIALNLLFIKEGL